MNFRWLVAVAVLAAMPALAQQKLKFAHVYETSEPKTFEAVFKEAAEKSNAEIARSEQQLVTDFATKYGRAVVKSDRDAFKKVFTPFLVGKDVPWDKALYDRVQAIK